MTVDEYLSRFHEAPAQRLVGLRSLITAVLPDAVEEIKWGVPAYSTTTILVTFAGFAEHVNLYLTPSLMDQFWERCEEFRTGKSALGIPYTHDLPEDLITKILLAQKDEAELAGVR